MAAPLPCCCSAAGERAGPQAAHQVRGRRSRWVVTGLSPSAQLPPPNLSSLPACVPNFTQPPTPTRTHHGYSERASAAGAAIKESAVGRTAGAAFGRIGSAVSSGSKKVLDNDKVCEPGWLPAAQFIGWHWMYRGQRLAGSSSRQL